MKITLREGKIQYGFELIQTQDKLIIVKDGQAFATISVAGEQRDDGKISLDSFFLTFNVERWEEAVGNNHATVLIKSRNPA